MAEYTVRIGTSKRKTPVKNYNALLDLPSREAKDDGKILVWGPGPWAWNSGPCSCGGTLQWAEAGYVPWHRICDRCGSHWTMYPVAIYLSGGHVCLDDADSQARLAGEHGEIFRRVIAMVRPEDITPEAIEHGAIYGGWARRARFHRG